MANAPKEIWISPRNYRWWTSPCEDLPLLQRYIHEDESKARIEQLEADNAKLRNAIRDAYEEGWGDYETPCCPMRSFEEVWAESNARSMTQENEDEQ